MVPVVNGVTKTVVKETLSALLVSPFKADHRIIHEVFSMRNWRLHTAPDCRSACGLLSTDFVGVVLCEQWLWDGGWKDVLRASNRLFRPPRLIVSARLVNNRLDSEVLLRGGYAVIVAPFDAHAIDAAVWLAWHSWRRQWRDGSTAT